jgi:ribosomal protein S18 acetylase RimI-like enzyme
MAAVTLVEMTTAEFARRRGPMIQEYAESVAALNGVPLRDAVTQAEQETVKSLADGPRTPGQLLRTAWVDGAEVGWIWASMPGHAVPEMAWIDELVVDEKYRRLGYGQAIMQAIEAELAGRGVSRLGLNVFGYNDVARRLYERLGFEVTQQQRGRSLSGVAGALESPVTLVPITSADFQRRMESYLAATMADYGLSAEAAQERVWQPLPHGLDTEDVYLRAVFADDAEVGWVCYGLRHPTRPGFGWLFRLDIDPAFRSHGYGTATVAVVEADLVARGVPRIGLSVPGRNAGARRLADRLGFTVTAQQMAKRLPAT